MLIYRYIHLDINLFQLPLKTEKLGIDWQMMLNCKIWRNTKLGENTGIEDINILENNINLWK